MRVYSYDDDVGALADFDTMLEAARGGGWELTTDSEGAAWGSKDLATGEATLSLTRYTEAGTLKISMRLEHAPCPAERCTGEPSAPASSAAGQTPKPQPLPGASPSSGQQSGGGLPLGGNDPGPSSKAKPYAWAGGPYVRKIGDPMELDASGLLRSRRADRPLRVGPRRRRRLREALHEPKARCTPTARTSTATSR